LLLVAGKQNIQPRERAGCRGIVRRGISIGTSVIGVIIPGGAGRTAVITVVIIAAIIAAIIVAVPSVPAEAVSVPVPTTVTVIIIVVVTTIGVVVVMFVFPFC
jgi:hypothetical protein